MNENNKVISILTLAEKAGMSTGFISTARATHATPAALYAHSADRNWESDKALKERAKDDYSTCTDIGNASAAVQKRCSLVTYKSDQDKRLINNYSTSARWI